MTTDITELTQESSRESGSILIIVAARMARREFFTPLHALCESGKRVVSTRALCDAVERAEEHMVSQVSKIVDGHDRLTKKLKEAESRNAELVEALEKAQQLATQQGNIACALFDEVTAQRQRIAELESRTVKLPVGYTASSGHPFNEAKRTVMIPGGGDWLNRLDVEHVLTAAGIKWEAE